MHVVTDFRACRERNSLYANKVGYLVQIFLRVGAQFIIHGHEHVLAAKVLEPFAQMERIAVAAAEIAPRLQHLVERAARPRVVSNQLIRRKWMIDRTAQRGDHSTVRNEGLDAIWSERMKLVWTDFSDR